MEKRKIVIIGAGKVAYSLVSALLEANYHVASIISRNFTSAKSLAKKFSIGHYSNNIKNIPEEVKIFFLTVPDGEIKNTAEGLSKLKRDFRDCICIHFSGVEDIFALKFLQRKECATGSLHIIRPFPSKNLVEIKNFPASIETEDKRAYNFLKQLCKSLKLKANKITSDEKVLNHLSAVHSSNFLVGNLYNAFSLISSKGDLPKEILQQTTHSALDNVFKLSPVKALSGPVDRGDLYAIKKHLEALDLKIKKSKKNKSLKLLRLSYIVQSLGLLNIAEKKYGRLNRNHQKIKKFLKEKFEED